MPKSWRNREGQVLQQSGCRNRVYLFFSVFIWVAFKADAQVLAGGSSNKLPVRATLQIENAGEYQS